MKLEKKIRVLVAKPGLDSHDRGAQILAAGLRDAGMEVIYTGIHQTPEAIINTAIQEDVDIICLSILSGAHVPLTRRIMELLSENRAEHIPVILGGVIPDKDILLLEKLQVKKVFQPMTTINLSVDYIRKFVIEKRKGETV